jgi:cellulose synthase/poly-beta-1,6-N-acetylglucosamine synthase-like glycosyltransferase
LGLYNDYADVEHRVKKDAYKHELSASVAISFHAGRDILERTITSLTQQTYSKDRFEVIIVADANYADAILIAEKYKREIDIKLESLSNNGFALASSRNAGIRAAKGDVIVSLDCDMICPPTFLQSHLKWFHKSDKIATIGLRKFVEASRIEPEDVVHDFGLISSLPEIQSISNTVLGSRKDKRIPELKQLMIHPFPSNCFHGGNVAYFRDDALNAGLWDEDFNGNYGYEDIDFGQRLFENGTKLAFENEATTYHQENNFVSPHQRQKGLLINRTKLYERYPLLAGFRKDVLCSR